ncbi:alpha/beta hydrolase [Aurantibacter sp.]|uniref:alpha/beta fold hydrolase n=1 Tax=Aurantibacter sp. TaxID=2807103 RepID=UPI003263B333
MIAGKNFKILFYVFGLLFIIASCTSIPKLSKADKSLIKEALKAPTTKIITGESGFAKNASHSIWYEKINPEIESRGTILLIMGNGQDALSWPPSLISNFTKSGYQVVRFDHRGTGLSTSTEKWKKKNAYSLTDMASDALAILDNLAIEKAHIVGASMGGMIAQIIAIEQPDRTATLTSIMSSGDAMDSELEPMSNEVIPQMISAILKHGFFGSKKGQIKRQIIQKRILMGTATGDIDIKTMAEVSAYNLKEREGYKLIAAKHHFEAILISETRNKYLTNLTIPTLIIHGEKDPVMPISHGKKMKTIIPNAHSLWINNMGHDLPDSKIDEITDAMLVHFEKTIK